MSATPEYGTAPTACGIVVHLKSGEVSRVSELVEVEVDEHGHLYVGRLIHGVGSDVPERFERHAVYLTGTWDRAVPGEWIAGE